MGAARGVLPSGVPVRIVIVPVDVVPPPDGSTLFPSGTEIDVTRGADTGSDSIEGVANRGVGCLKNCIAQRAEGYDIAGVRDGGPANAAEGLRYRSIRSTADPGSLRSSGT